MVIGFTRGVYDLFHVGHLNLLRNAKGLCDKLIVGVKTDELTLSTKRQPVISFKERIDIVRSCRYVDTAVAVDTLDFILLHEKLRFNILFVGDDWYSSERFNEVEKKLCYSDVKVIYLPHTDSTNSTLLTSVLKKINEE